VNVDGHGVSRLPAPSNSDSTRDPRPPVSEITGFA
jgi:hypothetical protein